MSLRKARKDAEAAIREIRKYSPSNDRHALLRRVILGSQPTASKNAEDFIFELQSLVDGGVFAKDFAEKMNSLLRNQDDDLQELRKTISETIRLTVPDDVSIEDREGPYVNGEHLFKELSSNNLLTIKKSSTSSNTVVDADSKSFKDPLKTNTSLVAFEILNPKISISARDTDATSIFLSMIPTLELSRCVPYINVAMFNENVKNENEGKLSGLSLVSFLVGKNEETKNLTSLDQASVLSLRPSNSDIPSGATSMELFTSPQTLVPQKGSSVFSERGNIPAILDRFRPPMSLVSFSVSVKPSTGFMSYKTATMELVLHDRSRLHEISNLIRPGVNNRTEMTIEYGWSNNYKGTAENNAFAVFMNSLKIREKYGIVNSSFRFDDSGQVNVTLNLFTKGVQQMEQMPMVSFGTESAETNLFKVLDEISQVIAERRGNPKFNKIFDQTLIEAFSSSSSLLSLDQKELVKLRKILESIRNKTDDTKVNAELVNSISNVLGTGEGSLDNLRKSTDSTINSKLSALSSGTEIFPCNLSQLKGFKSVSFPAVSVEDRRSISSSRKDYDERVEKLADEILEEKRKEATKESELQDTLFLQQEIDNDSIIMNLKDERNQILGFDFERAIKSKEIFIATDGLPSSNPRFSITSAAGRTENGQKIRSLRESLEKRTEFKEIQRRIRQREITNDINRSISSRIRAPQIEGKLDRQQARKKLADDGIRPPSSRRPATRTIQNPISLGRLLIAFVGESLRNSQSFDEIQFMFHTFNEKASFVRQMSIAKFPVDFNDFRKKIVEQIQKNPKISVMNTLQFILSEFVNDMSVKPYGFSFLYEQEKDDEDKPTGRLVRKKVETDKARKDEEAEQDKILSLAGIKDGKFKLPNVQIIPECVPNLEQPEKTILRLHVVDTQTTSYETLFSLIKSMRQGSFAELSSEKDGEHPLFPESPELKSDVLYRERQELIKDFKSITTQPATTAVNEIDIGKLLEGKSITETKRFVAEGMPTIFFGGSSGAIKSIGLSSMNDSRLSTVNILRMEKEPDLTNTIRDRGLPMQVLPVECSIETLGCPLFERMQHFFIDFGTGTTADNVYVVNEIEHKLGPGEFSTSLKMIFLESFMTYSSSRRTVKIANEVLANEFGVELKTEVSSPGSPVGERKHTGSKQILTISNAIPEIMQSLGDDKTSLFIILDENYRPIPPLESSSALSIMSIKNLERSNQFEQLVRKIRLKAEAKFAIDISKLLLSVPKKNDSNNIIRAIESFEMREITSSRISAFGSPSSRRSQPSTLQDISMIEKIYGPSAGALKVDFPSPGENKVLLDCTDYVEFLESLDSQTRREVIARRSAIAV